MLWQASELVPAWRSTSQERCYKHMEFKLQQGHPPSDRYPQTQGFVWRLQSSQFSPPPPAFSKSKKIPDISWNPPRGERPDPPAGSSHFRLLYITSSESSPTLAQLKLIVILLQWNMHVLKQHSSTWSISLPLRHKVKGKKQTSGWW